MNLIYTGPRKKEFGVVGNATGTRYTVRPGQPTTVDDADGAAILAQYPGLFVEAKPVAEPEPKGRRGRSITEPEPVAPEIEPEEQG